MKLQRKGTFEEQKETWGQSYKTFYGRNLFRSVESQTIHHYRLLSPQYNICGQGQEPTITVESLRHVILITFLQSFKVPGKPFQSSLMFVGKARSLTQSGVELTRVKHLSCAPLQGRLLALSSIIRPGWKSLPLAYYEKLLRYKKFYRFGHRGIYCKTFYNGN